MVQINAMGADRKIARPPGRTPGRSAPFEPIATRKSKLHEYQSKDLLSPSAVLAGEAIDPADAKVTARLPARRRESLFAVPWGPRQGLAT